MEQGRIHSVELLAMALAAAAQLGYWVREEVPAGFPGGVCEYRGQKWLFIDPSLSARERLQLVLDALACDPDAATLEMATPLASVLTRLRAA